MVAVFQPLSRRRSPHRSAPWTGYPSLPAHGPWASRGEEEEDQQVGDLSFARRRVTGCLRSVQVAGWVAAPVSEKKKE